MTDRLLLTTERIRAVMDDAVRRGRMTRHDAEALVQSLIESGLQPGDELLRQVSSRNA